MEEDMELEKGLPINKYETVVIFNPKYDGETTLKESIDMYKDMCQEFTGKRKIIEFEELGEKKLAYEIKSCKSGYYVIYYWYGTAENVTELERCLRINDKVIKFITVKREDDDLDEYAEPTEEELNEEEKSPSEIKSEQDDNKSIDALDVMLGFADYVKKITV